MYSGSFRVALKLYPLILIAIFGEIAIQTLKERGMFGSGGGIASFFIWSILACYAHMAILLPEKRDGRANNKILLGFIWRNLGLTALFFIPAVAIIIYGYETFETVLTGSDDLAFLSALLSISLPVTLIFLLVYSLLGTLLPAFVAGRRTGLKQAFRRGRRFFFPLMIRMIIGPGILYLGPLILYVFLSHAFDHPQNFFAQNWSPNLITIASYAVIYCLQGWSIVMAAWILSHTFLESEADEGAGEPVEISGEG